MHAIPRTFRTAAMGLALTAALAAQSGTNAGSGGHGASSLDAQTQQSQGNQMGQSDMSNAPNAAQRSNPGFGEQMPNDQSGTAAMSQDNSTYQQDRNGNQGFDLGWLGLLGLAGLFGIGRGRRSDDVVHHRHAHDLHDSGSNRS